MKGTFTLSSKWDRRYLSLAHRIASWSKDPSTQIGCIAVINGRVVAQGYNGLPRGIRDSWDRLSNRELKYKYIVHGEMNTIFNATFHGVSLAGSTMYVYGLPVCSDCALGIIQVGVERVVMPQQDVPEKWRDSWELTKSMFDEAGVEYTFIEYDGQDNYSGIEPI